MFFGNLEELKILFQSNKEFKKMSGKPKQIYKAGLCAIFVVLMQPGTTDRKIKEYHENIAFLKEVRKYPQNYNDDTILGQVRVIVRNGLTLTRVKDGDFTDIQDKIITFMRKVLESLSQGQKYLVTLEEVEEFWDVKKHLSENFLNTNPNLNKKSWIEIDLERGVIPTFPDFIAYANLISLWNIYLDKKQTLVETNRYTENLEYRKLISEINSLIQTLFVQCITFSESYFYYLFYNLKYQESYSFKDKGTEGFLNSTQPQDTEIIEKIVFKEFVKSSRDAILYQEYKKINSIRNRTIHASAFSENNVSHMMPLINLNSDILEESLSIVIEFIKSVEDRLPSELKVMHWWHTLSQHPDFKGNQKGNFIHRKDIY